jgi:decaprenylphospho-beta-D-ribofuranose 2-oxidase
MSGAARLTGWGRTTASQSLAIDLPADPASLFVEPAWPRGLIAHGAGRSYGDCALNAGGAVLMTAGRNRILDFDAQTGIVQAEPGVTFAQLLATFLPQGFVVPVTPGTGFATMGGAVANDVHGKNHEQAGSFGQHVTALGLVTPDGTHHALSPASDPPLFAATMGGIGLTGIVTSIALRLKRIAGPAMIVRSQSFQDLETLLAAMQQAAGASHSVAWIDGTATGRHLGRGILETAEPGAASDRADPPSRRLTVPFDFPGFALNSLSVRAFNELYFRRIPKAGRTDTTHLARFFYPLDALHRWNRIYGSRGFYQFQCVLPFEHGAEALRSLLALIAHSGRASFLSVLKRMGPGRAGYLSFPRPGYTLALDFPARAGIGAFYARLVGTVLDCGGRIYLGKDALLTRAQFLPMYPEYPAFRAVLDRLDPGRLMQSDMQRRLGL